MPLSLEGIRTRILIAMFSDDDLMSVLVLKGGNALALVHKVGARASIDIDFSIVTPFSEIDRFKAKIFAALEREFNAAGYIVFDEAFEERPTIRAPEQPVWWGGYVIKFKLAEKSVYEVHGDDLDALRRNAMVVGPSQLRTYTIDISYHEFCEDKIRRDVDDYAVYVYSLEMIASEKLRAICQQMPDYSVFRTKRPRARDFYDIYEIVHENGIDLAVARNRSTLSAIFAAKQVPLKLLGNICLYRDYHAQDWPAVETALSGSYHKFDVYFDFVSTLASRLNAFWNE
jgi:hypothetical protein